MEFIEDIIVKAKSDKKTIVLPETNDERTIKAASKIAEMDFANIVLIGNEEKIKEIFPVYDLKGITFIDHLKSGKIDEYTEKLWEIRKSKGMTIEQARETMKNPIYFTAIMLKNDDADGMVAGAANSTANTLRPVLQIVKTAKDSKIVSAGYIICLEDKSFGYNGVMLYADTTLVENPDEKELAEIAISSAKTFNKITGTEPKVALLSYSTHGSAMGEMVEKVVNATKLAKEAEPDMCIDGELQFDAAVIPEIGKYKAPKSEVEGKANVLIFPDINSGNIAYKITERMGNAKAYAITQGFVKPVSDLSRGCSADDIVTVVAITAVLAQD